MLRKVWIPILLLGALILTGCTAESQTQFKKIVLTTNVPDEVPKKQKIVTIEGQAKNANRLVVNGVDMTALLYKDGSFTVQYPLKEGRNEINIVAAYIDDNGKELTNKSDTLIVYRQDPQIKLEFPNTDIETQKNKTPINGTTEPGAKVTLYQDSKKLSTVTADKNGEFKFTLPTSKSTAFTVKSEKSGFSPMTVELSVERVLSAAEEKARYKKSCKTISYKKLKKNADRYKGDRYKTRGQIIQIMEDGNTTIMRIAVTKDNWGYWNYDDVIYVEYEGTTDFVEEDVVTVYGEIYGDYSYTSIAGWEITVPGVVAKYIEK